MLQFFDTLTDDSGNSLLGATMTVLNYPSGTVASIYNTNGTASPIPTATVVADITGQVSFYIPDGAYTLQYSYKSTPYKTRSPVNLLDPLGFVSATDTGAANAYLVNSSAYPASLYVGLKVEIEASNANTGPSTFNLNSTGNQPIVQPGGGALALGQIQKNGLYRLEWDGAQWQLFGASSAAFYARTAAEISASIVPTNFNYPQSNILRYGADPTDTTDSTAAIQSAITVAQTAGGDRVVMPFGVYKTIATLTVTGLNVAIQGSGWGTTLSPTGTTNDVIDISANGCDLSDFVISAAATRSAGYFVNVVGAVNYARIRRVQMFNWFNAVGVTGSGAGTTFRLLDCNITTTVAGGVGVVIDTTNNWSDMVIEDIFVIGPTSGAQCLAGIQVTNVGDLSLLRVSTEKCGAGLNIQPASGQSVQAIFCSDSFFDSGSGTGVAFNMQGTGTVELAKFVNVWSCTNANGFVLSASNAGTLTRSEFINCIGSNNAAGAGFLINGTGVTNTLVVGGSYAANTNGLSVVAGVTLFKFLGVTASASGEFAGNSNVGLVLSGTNDKFTIADCDFSNNVAAASVITAPSGGIAGQSWFIKGNQGIVTSNGGGVALTAAGTSTVVNHGLAAAPRLQDIQLTMNGGWGTAGQFWASTVTATQFTIGTAAAPGAGVLCGWNARLWGA